MLTPDDFDAALLWAKDVSAGGNPALAVERLARLAYDSTPLQRLLAISIPGVVSAAGRGLLPGELLAIRDVLKPIGTDSLWDGSLAEIAKEKQELDGIGLVFALTARRDRQGQMFGAVHPLRIVGELGEPHRPLADGSVAIADDARLAYETGIQAALRYLHQHGAGSLDASTVLRSFGFSAQLPAAAFRAGLSGSSMGLATGLAVLSALLRCPLLRPLAITGALSGSAGNDTIRTIGEFSEKCAAARGAALPVMCPAGNVEGPPPPEVVKVGNFAEAVSVAFGERAVEERLAELSIWRLPVQARRRFFEAPDDAGEDEQVGGILISAVGGEDPKSGRHDGGDGPILTLCRHFKPRWALILHTPDEVFTRRAEDVRQELAAMGCDAQPRALSVENPTDMPVIFAEFRSFVQGFLEEAGDLARVPILTNVTSGAPQLRTALHLLVERGLLPDFRYETIQPTHAGGGKRYKRVRLPVI